MLLEKLAKLGSTPVFGADSGIWSDSLQRTGASGLLHQLLVRFRYVVETMDDEALCDELSVGKRTKLMLSNDIKDRMRMCEGTTMIFTQTQLDLEPRSAESCVHESSVCCAHSKKCILCTHTL